MMWDGKRTKPVNNNSTNRKEGEVFKAQRRLQKPKFLDPPFLFPNPHSPIVARSIEMVHRPEPIGRRWWDRDRGRVGLGIAVALDDDDDDAGPSPRNPHTAAPITIRSPRVRCGSSVRTGRAGFSVGFCGGARAQVGDSPVAAAEESCAADFLSNCYVCRKKLHGEDIFMYREKAFCSMECRYEKMVADEYQEKHSSKARKRSPEITSSPCSGGQLFFTGIVVT